MDQKKSRMEVPNVAESYRVLLYHKAKKKSLVSCPLKLKKMMRSCAFSFIFEIFFIYPQKKQPLKNAFFSHAAAFWQNTASTAAIVPTTVHELNTLIAKNNAPPT